MKYYLLQLTKKSEREVKELVSFRLQFMMRYIDIAYWFKTISKRWSAIYYASYDNLYVELSPLLKRTKPCSEISEISSKTVKSTVCHWYCDRLILFLISTTLHCTDVLIIVIFLWMNIDHAICRRETVVIVALFSRKVKYRNTNEKDTSQSGGQSFRQSEWCLHSSNNEPFGKLFPTYPTVAYMNEPTSSQLRRRVRIMDTLDDMIKCSFHHVCLCLSHPLSHTFDVHESW